MAPKIIVIEDEPIEQERLRVAFLGTPVEFITFNSYSEFFEVMALGSPLSADDTVIIDCNIDDDGSLNDSLERDMFWRRRFGVIQHGRLLLHTGQTGVVREREALTRLGYQNIHHVIKGDFDTLMKLAFRRDDGPGVGHPSSQN